MVEETSGGPSPADPGRSALAALRRLRRPQERRAAGVCIAEGPHLVREALAAGLRPVAAFGTRAWSESADGGPLVAQLLPALQGPAGLGPAQMPIGLHLFSERAFARVADTVSPQGLLCVFELPPAEPVGEPSAWTLVLDGVQDPGNVGTLARALLAFGGVGALLLTGAGTADPFGEKALRSSAGAVFRLRHRHAGPQLTDALGGLKELGVHLWALCPRGGRLLADAALEPPAALLVGSEARGVSPATMALCTPVTVPMPGPAESLNAALAGAIALYEAAGRRQRA